MMGAPVQPAVHALRGREEQRGLRAPFGITLWLLFSALMSIGGWILSALHQLNTRGYAIYLLLAAGMLIWWEASRGFADLKTPRLGRLVRRFKRPLPFGFLLLAILALTGGLLYPPSNYDALAYRIPRVLHWLAYGQWHWVHTEFHRLNDRACGAEWLTAPLIAFTGSIRWIFFPNIISYLLLPGLLFSVFTRFGIRRKVAWHWMWITATGYGFVTQAGSIANDLLGAVYVLAAFDFALRLRQSKRWEDFALFVIAAALMTGSKASNFPLLLPLFLIVCSNWRVPLLKPAKSFLVIALAGLASFLPTAVLNLKNCGDWTGMRLEGPMLSPGTQIVANSGIWMIQNLSPPIFPLAGRWNHPLADTLATKFKTFGGVFHAPELQAEEGAGLGLGICLLLVVSLVVSWLIRRRSGKASQYQPMSTWWKLVMWSSYFSLLVFGLKAQVVSSSARLIIPYYAILMVPLLLLFSEELFRRRWWKFLVAAVFGMAVLLVVISPGRPLWPAQSVLGKLKASHPSSPLIARAETVYSVYAGRADGFAPLVAELPPDATVVGFVTFDDPETSLWWPLGSRRIEHVISTDTRQELEARGIKYIVVSSQSSALHGSIEGLLQKYDAKIIKTVPLLLRAGQGMTDWYIIELRQENSARA